MYTLSKLPAAAALNLAALALTGCAAPIQLTERDLETTTAQFNQPVAEVAHTFWQGAQSCSGAGRADCAPADADGHVMCNIYAANVFRDAVRSLAIGRVDFEPAPGGSLMTVSVRTSAGITPGIRQKQRAYWIEVAQNTKRCP